MTQRTNAEWLNDLECDGERRSQALADLRAMILDGLPYALDQKIPLDNPVFGDISTKVIQKTLASVQENLAEYKSTGGFTTWVLKFAVRQALFEARLYHWQTDSPTDGLPEVHPGMYVKLAQDKPLYNFHQIMKEELTDNQRAAIRSMVMFRMPKEEVARHLKMELCDYFAMIHDARLRMKKRLQADRWLPL